MIIPEKRAIAVTDVSEFVVEFKLEKEFEELFGKDVYTAMDEVSSLCPNVEDADDEAEYQKEFLRILLESFTDRMFTWSYVETTGEFVIVELFPEDVKPNTTGSNFSFEVLFDENAKRAKEFGISTLAVGKATKYFCPTREGYNQMIYGLKEGLGKTDIYVIEPKIN